MTDREVMQQALEALEFANVNHWWGSLTIEKATDTLRTALEQQAEPPEWLLIKNILDEYGLQAISFVAEWKASQQQAEPVAWMFQHEETGRTMCVDAQQVEWGFEKGNPRYRKVAPLYTTPPQRQWVGLTDEDFCDQDHEWIAGASWAEAKLKEKNSDPGY